MWDEEPKAGTNNPIPDEESEEEPLEGVEQEGPLLYPLRI